jgi:hypothetical protein
MSDVTLRRTKGFVGRVTELNKVVEKAKMLAKPESLPRRTIVVRSLQGGGKTWFSKQLHRKELSNLSNVISFLIRIIPVISTKQKPDDDFPIMQDDREYEIGDRAENENVQSSQEVLEILKRMANTLQARTEVNATLDEQITWLASSIDRLSRAQDRKVIVLIVDSIIEADPTLQATLETHLLAPLAPLTNVLIVLTGRGQLPLWRSNYLRQYKEEIWLEPFNIDQIREQTGSNEARAIRIKELGGGYPRNNWILAQYDSENEGLEQVMAFQYSYYQRRMSDWCRTLCVLSGFREEMMQKMLEANPNTVSDSGKVEEVRREMIEHGLLQWKDGEYYLDDAVAISQRHYLKRDPEMQKKLWIPLNCRALEIYKAYLAHFQENSRAQAFYQKKLEQHTQALKDVGYSVEECDSTRTPETNAQPHLAMG